MISKFKYSLFKKITVLKKYKVRLIEVDMSSQDVIFHIRKRALFLKCKLAEAIADISIIEQLNPIDSCWLGGYYGRALRASYEGRLPLKKAEKALNFLLDKEDGRYKVIFQNRRGEVGYLDKITKQEFVEHPLTIANNKHIISKFEASQACYIGVLAGISLEKFSTIDKKNINSNKAKELLNRPPKLRIVK